MSSCYEKGQATGAIFIVLSEAFDMVDHCLFVYTLYSVGLTKNALLSFNAYVHYRCQCVVFRAISLTI